MNYISVIVPLYNEEEVVVKNVTNRLEFNLSKINDDWKIILVDDGSNNDCWNSILKISKNNNKISGIKLSKNFGQHCAIKAGIDNSKSKYSVVMDGDMQDDPKYIQELHDNIIKGYDIVYCERYERKDLLQNFFSKIFYTIHNFLSKEKLNQKISNFCIFNEKTSNQLKKNKLTHMSFFASIKSLNNNEKFIKTLRNERQLGTKPTYSFKNRVKLAKNTLISFSDRLLYISVILGILFFIISIMGGSYIIIKKLFLNPSAPVLGWTSLVTITLFSFGLTNLSIGIMGLYINSIHNIVKENDPYLIREKINLN
jgi:polyisoprenyl-phosphate glycosyltransferase